MLCRIDRAGTAAAEAGDVCNEWMGGACGFVVAVPGADRGVVLVRATERNAGARVVGRDHDRALRAAGRRDPADEQLSGADRAVAGEA